ncbi:hypothetical protein FISHEDRAFT_64708 [Fistulina hepatica ATCC 64428]|uniref:Pre-mRNA polyadenylation factor Fip1 domain-containing protein n=1 Tax=Fistulina hepatica ATCC 64428 TaxID=1128425 RepID=A0A0D7AH79_9AGAR|nr:hypothetical protein FISHEDRAFT_64708 [Fistulina hepatica ATCC 64428]
MPQPSLTTEYTPMQRAGLMSPTTSTSQQPTTASSVSHAQNIPDTQDKIDTSKLPPVTAPPSHPSIDPDIVGTLDGRSILEVDLAAMSDKQWRRPGADISDWFNYGFDEISWEAYCYRRRELGDLAAVMKTNVINFAGMQEDQLQGLPPDARQMVMTGVNTMLNTSGAMMNAAANPAMMNAASSAQMLGPGVMMDMGMMPMGMGMNGEMGMNGSMMSGLMPQEGASSGAGPVDQGAGGMMSDAYGPPGMMMNMGMGGEYDMQPSMVNQMGQTMTPGQSMNQQNQQIYSQSVEATPPTQPAAARGGTQATFRGRGQRGGRAVFPVRGRGRGGIYGSEAVPVVPLRSTSPLPPNVPTGPRSQNKYKDRDNNGPAVDGLDYGGGKDISRISSREPDDRISRDDRMRDRDVHDRGRDDRGLAYRNIHVLCRLQVSTTQDVYFMRTRNLFYEYEMFFG